MNALNEVLTVKEAANIWELTADSINQNCRGRVKGQKAFTDEEKRKSAGTWLVTRAGMTRVYGEAPEK